MSDFTDIGGSEIMRVLKTKKLVGSKVLEMPRKVFPEIYLHVCPIVKQKF